MGFKTIICKNGNCGKEIKVKRIGRRKYCDECQSAINLKYQTAYQKAYRESGNINREDKRHYTRKGESNSEYLDYCKKNFNTPDGSGCRNCICPECIEPEKSDEFLPWEQEGFYEDNFKK